MQITVTLPDEIGKRLIGLPNPDYFITELLKTALPYPKKIKKRPLGILEGKGNFEIKTDFKMTDEEFLLS